MTCLPVIVCLMHIHCSVLGCDVGSGLPVQNDDDVCINSVESKLPSHCQAWVRNEDERSIHTGISISVTDSTLSIVIDTW